MQSAAKQCGASAGEADQFIHYGLRSAANPLQVLDQRNDAAGHRQLDGCGITMCEEVWHLACSTMHDKPGCAIAPTPCVVNKNTKFSERGQINN